MVTLLDWDTKCFGYPVGRIIIKGNHTLNNEELKILANDFHLLYIFSKTEIPIKSEKLILSDKKIILKRKTELYGDSDFSFIETYQGTITDQLLDLTYQSGIYSRFNVDRNFVNNEFQTLYRLWIERSIKRLIVRDVFVYKILNELVGFVTLAVKKNMAEVGLIAVDHKVRGLGIGSTLLRYTISEAKKMGYSGIQVTTQQDNVSALALYEKNGFEISDLTYIYHYWNK